MGLDEDVRPRAGSFEDLLVAMAQSAICRRALRNSCLGMFSVCKVSQPARCKARPLQSHGGECRKARGRSLYSGLYALLVICAYRPSGWRLINQNQSGFG